MSTTRNEKIKALFVEISGSKDRVKAEQDFVNDAINSAADSLSIDKKVLRKAADMFHRQNDVETSTMMEDAVNLVQSL